MTFDNNIGIMAVQKTIEQGKAAGSGDQSLKLEGADVVVLDTFIKNLSSFNDISDHFFDALQPAIKDQIKAIDLRTEEAADSILSAAENLMTAVGTLPEDSKEKIQNEVNAIFEASNFQDLVSQHAREIGLRINELASDMKDLHAFLDGKGHDDARIRSREQNKADDAHLLNGPLIPTTKSKKETGT